MLIFNHKDDKPIIAKFNKNLRTCNAVQRTAQVNKLLAKSV